MNTNLIDWIRGTFPAMNLPEVKQLLTAAFGESAPGQHAFFGYDTIQQWPNGAWICSFTGDNVRLDACVSIPGAAMAELDLTRTYVIVRDLAELGFTCTRVDCTHDDAKKHIHPEALGRLLAAAVDGDNLVHVSGFQYARWISSSKRAQDKGSTVELGRRGSNGSGKFLRVYDKTIESEGAIDAIRWEVELTGERARDAFYWLATSDNPEQLLVRIGNIVGGVCDFYHKPTTTEKNIPRMKKMPWWDALQKQLGQAVFPLPSEATPFERTVKWINTCTAKPYAMLKHWFSCHPEDGNFDTWIQANLKNGETKLSDLDRLIAAHGTLTPVLLYGGLPGPARFAGSGLGGHAHDPTQPTDPKM